jgi:nicotinate-nucleotide pyrophosphorylase (carboxylating)
MSESRFGFSEIERKSADTLIRMAIDEDHGDRGDITSAALIPEAAWGSIRFVGRAGGVLAGLPVVERLVTMFALTEDWNAFLADGDDLGPGTVIARLDGPMRCLLALERPALNVLQHMSGIATLTKRFVTAVAGTRAQIMDTRKTTPGWRALEKYAVRCGGGVNHRFGLSDAVLIKDNHLAWLQSVMGFAAPQAIAAAIAAARAHAPPETIVEIEVDSLEQFDCALEHAPDIILVDNFGPELLAEAVRRRDAVALAIKLEASGGVNLETVPLLARTGVDRISVGALTHSAAALDIAVDYAMEPAQQAVDTSAAAPGRFKRSLEMHTWPRFFPRPRN